MSSNLSGKAIRGYELRYPIGSGGFGEVYNAYQRVVDREVAIKIIHAAYAKQPEFIRRFEIEARLVARLEHLHIVPLYDYWRDPTGAYLVMRWLRGGSVRTMLRNQGRLPLETTIKIFRQVASALAVAHTHGVIHRDIKPENILLDEEGNAYLTDFGIAVDVNTSSEIIKDAMSFGSPAYMSPEQLLRKSVTPEADVYSLGVLLFEMLAGKNPFPDETTQAIVEKQSQIPIPSISAMRPDVLPLIDAVIWKAIAKVPSARYSDTLSMVAALEKAASGYYAETGASAPIGGGDFNDGSSGTVRLGDEPPVNSTVQLGTPARSVMEVGTMHLAGSTPGDVPPAIAPKDRDSAGSTPPATGITGQAMSGMVAVRNPYKGLRPFEEVDSGDFFGRDESVDRLLRFLSETDNRFLAVIGPSGSGKSSLVKAGLISELRRGGVFGSESWYYLSMVPGANPFGELAEALRQVAIEDRTDIEQTLRAFSDGLNIVATQLLFGTSELFIFIDQFEELFTQTESENDRAAFLDRLQQAVTSSNSRVRIVLTLRADFYDRPLQYASFGALVREYAEVVLPLSPFELEEAIVKPAERARLMLEPGLSRMIVEEVYQQPGALPLLQYALTELFERRADSTLTIDAYGEIGGVTGALARRAEEIYRGLPAEQKDIAQWLFLQLVTVDAQAGATRRRVIWSDLFKGTHDRHVVEAVIQQFSHYRLLTLDRDPITRSPTVEIAHEALISRWERLQLWIDENRADLQKLNLLAAITGDWVTARRDPSFLVRGTRLAEFEALLDRPFITLNIDEREFVKHSIDMRQRAVLRTRLVIAALAVFSVVAFALALLAFDRQRQAEIAQADAIAQRDRANLEAQQSRSRELAATSLSVIDRPELAMLLGVEAVRTANTFEARSSLLASMQAKPLIYSYLYANGVGVRTTAYSPNGRIVAAGLADGHLARWDHESLQPLEPLIEAHDDAIADIAFANGGARIVTASTDGTVKQWDTVSGEQVGEGFNRHQAAVWSVDAQPDGELIASGDANGEVVVWNASTGRVVYEWAAHEDVVFDVAFSPDGTILATAGGDNLVRLWDLATGESIGQPLAGHTNWVLTLAFHPNGALLVSAGADTSVIVWDVASQAVAAQYTSSHTDWVRDIAFNSTGEVLVTVSVDGTVRLLDVLNGRRIGDALIGHRDPVWGVSFQPDTLRFVTGGADGQMIIWDLQAPLRPSVDALPIENSPLAISHSPTTSVFAAGLPDGSIALWDTETRARVALFEGQHTDAVTTVAYSADGRLLASGAADTHVIIWDVERGEPLHPPLQGHDAVIWDVAFTPDGARLYSTGDDGQVLVWDVQQARRAGRVASLTTGVLSLTVSPDGRLLALGGREGEIMLVDTATGLAVSEAFSAHTDAVTGLVFTPDNRVLISSGRDGQIQLWDVATRELLFQPVQRHTDWILDLAISPDGSIIASGGRDTRVILWDTATGRPVGDALTGHIDWVTGVQFAPDGRLYSASRDTSVRLWTVDPDDWIALACRVSNRQLSASEWQQYFPNETYRPTCDL